MGRTGHGAVGVGMLEGKVAAVTDSGEGMGREIALWMAREGARVVVNDSGGCGRGPSVAEEVAEEIRDSGGDALANSESAASWEGAHRLVQASLDHFGRIDILVNNVNTTHDHQGCMIFETSEEDWEVVLRSQLKATFCCTRAVLPHMRAQRQGRLIHFTSAAGLIGMVGRTSHGAVKMAIAGFSRNVAIEMERYQVTSNCIAPIACTQPVTVVPPAAAKLQKASENIREIVPTDVAPLTVFLASESARSLSGQIFGVRGSEIFLFSQPRIGRSIHNSQGWTVEGLTGILESAMRPHFTSMDTSDAYFSWDPMV